ncbi:MAG: hypothetical protein IPK04_05340 [Bdellovibrionales bacterium]|nr:hypothetical protein [Bdellovibrionales bacterium]
MSKQTFEIYLGIIAQINDPFPEEPRTPAGWRAIKPLRVCLDLMKTKTRLDEGSRTDQLIYALAKELHRRGLDTLAIEQECVHFNNHNMRVRFYSGQVRTIVKNAINDDHYHSCHHWVLSRFCVGVEKCEWAKAANHQSHKAPEDREYFDKLYATLLKIPVRTVYNYFLQEEERLKLRPGQTIQRSYRKIASDLKLTDKGVVQRSCQKLAEMGLLKISPGMQGESTGLCSRFARVSPLPAPKLKTNEAINVHKI